MVEHAVLETPGAGRFGEVYDRGYQHYEGERLGRQHAFRALTTYSMKRALGAKKSWTAKVIPVLLYVAISIVVVIPLGIRAILDDAGVVEYWQFFSIVFVILGVYVATVAPEMLCNDRRESVLTLYFSRAIKRGDYLLAKLLGTALLTMTISFVPMVIYWLGRQLLDDAPLAAFRANAGDLGRITIMSVLTAFYLGAVGLAVSSFTGRKAIAVAIIVIGFGVSSALAGLLAVVINDPDLLPYAAFLSPARVVNEFSHGLFNETIDDDQFGRSLSTWVYGAFMLAVIGVCCAVMYWRYVPED